MAARVDQRKLYEKPSEMLVRVKMVTFGSGSYFWVVILRSSSGVSTVIASIQEAALRAGFGVIIDHRGENSLVVRRDYALCDGEIDDLVESITQVLAADHRLLNDPLIVLSEFA